MKRILFIENDHTRSELIRAAFQERLLDISLQFAPSRSHAVEAAMRDGAGIIFIKSDPDGAGDFVRQVSQTSLPVLLVFVMDRMDEKYVLQALKCGATECVSADAEAIQNYPAVADRVLARYQAICDVPRYSIPHQEGPGTQQSDPGPEIRRLRELLYRSSPLTAVGSLVSGIVHEINNPLTGTLAYTELLAMKVNDEDVKEDLKKILESAERCKNIIDNLLAFSRHRAPAKSIGSISGIIEQTVNLRRYALRSENIEVLTDFGAASAILADVQQIQQALLYILLNAEEAASSPGRTPRRICFITRENRDDRTITIQITDTGAGFNPGIIARIFDPFFTTKTGKCGLGLALAREIITNHGGVIEAGNGEEGAVVTIVIPTGA